MAKSEEPPFSSEKRGFFVSAFVINQKAVHLKGGTSFFDPPFLSRR
jgi:hypothetical protein